VLKSRSILFWIADFRSDGAVMSNGLPPTITAQ